MTLAHDLTDTSATRPTGPLLEAFERLSARVRFGREEEIYGQDDDAEMFYRVVTGVVRTSKLTFDGRRLVGGFYYAGDLGPWSPSTTHPMKRPPRTL